MCCFFLPLSWVVLSDGNVSAVWMAVFHYDNQISNQLGVEQVAR